jgi:hypothetical protein
MKKATSFRLSDTTRDILAREAEEMGISRTAVLEILVRQVHGLHPGNIRNACFGDFRRGYGGSSTDIGPVWHAGFAAGWYARQLREEELSEQ